MVGFKSSGRWLFYVSISLIGLSITQRNITIAESFAHLPLTKDTMALEKSLEDICVPSTLHLHIYRFDKCWLLFPICNWTRSLSQLWSTANIWWLHLFLQRTSIPEVPGSIDQKTILLWQDTVVNGAIINFRHNGTETLASGCTCSRLKLQKFTDIIKTEFMRVRFRMAHRFLSGFFFLYKFNKMLLHNTLLDPIILADLGDPVRLFSHAFSPKCPC